METITQEKHKGPHIGMLAIIFTVLFITGLYFVISFTPGNAHFPNPADTGEIIATYFRNNPHAALMCAFFQFGSAIPLGLYFVNVVSRLHFLGIKAAGSYIALFGGLMVAINQALSSLILWVMSYPDMAQDTSIIRALYYMVFAMGGVGFSVPLGIFIAGVSVTAGFAKLLPKWLVWCGLVLALCGVLSWLSLIFPQLLILVPLTRFPGFIWLIITGFVLPRAIVQKSRS